MSSIAPQIHEKTEGETRLLSVDFGSSASGDDERTGKLSSGELLFGEVTVATQAKSSDTTVDLTYASQDVNGTALTINGRDALVGEVAQFTAAGGTDGTTYTISVSASTNATPVQTLEGFAILKVEEPN